MTDEARCKCGKPIPVWFCVKACDECIDKRLAEREREKAR